MTPAGWSRESHSARETKSTEAYTEMDVRSSGKVATPSYSEQLGRGAKGIRMGFDRARNRFGITSTKRYHHWNPLIPKGFQHLAVALPQPLMRE